MEPPTTVALVEDEAEARQRLSESIRAQAGLRLVGEWRTGGEALTALAQGAPDVLLVDLGLPDMSGLKIVRYVAERYPACDILVVTIFGDERTVLAALEAGAREAAGTLLIESEPGRGTRATLALPAAA
jgi:DNA-binding NarL/FixJ family response regulator